MRYCQLGHPGCLYIGDAQHEPQPVCSASPPGPTDWQPFPLLSCACTNQCRSCGACCAVGCSHRLGRSIASPNAGAADWDPERFFEHPISIEPPSEPPLTEKRVREIVREERAVERRLRRDQWIMTIPIKVRTPAPVIAQAIRFDHDVSANAERILAALTEAGFVISRKIDAEPRPDLPETARMYAP